MFSRIDATEIFLRKYDDLSVDYQMLEYDNQYENAFVESKYIQELFLQTYFANQFILLDKAEKEELNSILSEKYMSKLGICDDFSTAWMFHDIGCELAEVDYNLNLSTASGFTRTGEIYKDAYEGTEYYKGVYEIYNTTTNCLEYKSGEYTTTERNMVTADFENVHTSFVRVSPATKKYNCHSYAWIDSSSWNIYWLNTPDILAGSSSFSYVNKNGSANAGDRIVIRSDYYFIDEAFGDVTNAKHSVIVNSYGSNINSIKTTSKLGSLGVYDASLVDVMLLYEGSYYETYR